MANTNFLILLGGPGKFVGCDKLHDQTWTNYLVPIQLAAMNKFYKLDPGEQVHWVVYEPAYRNRWDDDSVITKTELKQSDGYWLHSNRKAKADAVIKKGAHNYLHRIKQIANKHGIKYKGISNPSEFWGYIKSMPDNSVSRVWYSGHAAGTGLMLSLIHNSACGPAANIADMVLERDVSSNKALRNKFTSKPGKVSKFYGCYTSTFAQSWNRVFGVKTEGAVNKVDFSVVDRKSSVSNILERIEATGTSAGPTGWKKFHTITATP
jgi:hypothetical protein